MTEDNDWLTASVKEAAAREAERQRIEGERQLERELALAPEQATEAVIVARVEREVREKQALITELKKQLARDLVVAKRMVWSGMGNIVVEAPDRGVRTSDKQIGVWLSVNFPQFIDSYYTPVESGYDAYEGGDLVPGHVEFTSLDFSHFRIGPGDSGVYIVHNRDESHVYTLDDLQRVAIPFIHRAIGEDACSMLQVLKGRTLPLMIQENIDAIYLDHMDDVSKQNLRRVSAYIDSNLGFGLRHPLSPSQRFVHRV